MRCSSPKEVQLPKGGAAPQRRCSSLKEVQLPKGGAAPQRRCSSLKEVQLPKGGAAPQRRCSSLKVAQLPKGGAAPQRRCSSLKEVLFDGWHLGLPRYRSYSTTSRVPGDFDFRKSLLRCCNINQPHSPRINF